MTTTLAAVGRSLDELAKLIKAEHTAVTGALENIDKAKEDADKAKTVAVRQANVVSRAIKAGELLKEAKAKLPHGEWLSWLKKQCELSQRTAQRYMKSCGGQAEARTKAAGEIRHSGGFDLEPGCRATQTAA